MSVHDHMPGVKEVMQRFLGIEVGGPIRHNGARPNFTYRFARRLMAKAAHRRHMRARKELNRAG